MDTKQKKKALAGAVAGVAALALIGGGTFALWSDFYVDPTPNTVGAGQLTLGVGETMTQSAQALNLAPGQNRYQARYIASNDGDSVPNGNLSVTVTDVRDLDDGCTSSSEGAIDDCTSGSAGDLSRELDFRIEAYAPAGTAANPCATIGPAVSGNGTLWRGTLIASETLQVPVAELSPGEGVCVQFYMELRRNAASAPPPGNAGTAVPAATNASQGDEAAFDVRYDLVQV